jgi:hypothetical protein
MNKNVINLNVKVKGGVRTPIEVDVLSTSVNPRTLKFKNGVEITERQIAKWIKKYLETKLKKWQDLTNMNFFD